MNSLIAANLACIEQGVLMLVAIAARIGMRDFPE